MTPQNIRTFATAAAFETWLSRNHQREREVWVKLHKKGSGLRSVTVAEALDIVLCWGWIDGIRKRFDERSYLQRYTPRGRRSPWSQINRDHVARLVDAGRMTVHGQQQVDAAKADGRWNAAYAPMRTATPETVPPDLRAAIRKNPKAQKTFDTLNRANLFSLTYRTNAMKTAEGRARKISTLVAMLARGETVTPQRAKAT